MRNGGAPADIVDVCSHATKCLLLFVGGGGAKFIKYIALADISNGSNTKSVGGICADCAEIPSFCSRGININDESGVAGSACGNKRGCYTWLFATGDYALWGVCVTANDTSFDDDIAGGLVCLAGASGAERICRAGDWRVRGGSVAAA